MKLRSYQNEIIEAQREFMLNDFERKGMVFSPTGSGKTVCFDALISELIEGHSDKRICIVYPRIALALDQQARLKDKKNVEFTSFHSGSNNAPEEAKIYREQISTTCRKALEKIQKTSKMNHITFVTYHSFKHIADKDYDLIICDEAHNLVQRNFSRSLTKIKSKVIFYTATPINAISGLETVEGMNNKELFGNVLVDIKPKELITKGYIVQPQLVELNIKTDMDGTIVKPQLAIAHAFMDQKMRLHRLTNKMLVAMSDTKCFNTIQENGDEVRKMVGDVDIYTITAGSQCKNGVNLSSREAALEDFGKNTKQCIILHCDTLAEGIDVPGITGVFVFRTLSKAKFIQTIGRAARPCLADMNEKTGEVIDINNRLKPYAIITVAVIDDEYYANINGDTICEAFIEGGYGDSLKDITQFIVKERADNNKVSLTSSTIATRLEQDDIEYKTINGVTAEQVELQLAIDNGEVSDDILDMASDWVL